MPAFRRGSRGHGRLSAGGRGPNLNRRGGTRVPNTNRRGHKPTFHSTRVEEIEENPGDHSSEGSREDAGGNDTSLEVSSEDEESASLSAINPYNVLLESLKANVQREEPARKRRKVLHDGTTEQLKEVVSNWANQGRLHSPEDADLMVETEDEHHLSPEDAPDSEDEMNDQHSHDPFDTHFNILPEQTLPANIQQVTSSNWRSSKSILGSEWRLIELSTWQTSETTEIGAIRNVRDLRIKKKLHPGAENLIPSFRGLMGDLAARVFGYQDLLYCDRTPENGSELRSLTCLHAINHILKTRDTVIKNNARLAKVDVSEDVEFRDQGFTRPKVLMLLPTRESCVRTIDTIVSLCTPEQQENRKRFQETYVQREDYFSDEKPADFRELFAGNDDDMFRLGMKFTRKTLKYFSQFYNSDIIFASPLGLKMVMGADDSKKGDQDFLSSIEIVIVDQTDALLMQNWEHVEHIFENLNLQPKETHGCDFSRVRNWYLDGNAKYLRQTIILSAFNTPEINRLFGHFLSNLAGKVKICKKNYEGSILYMNVPIKQTFSRYDASQPTEDPDARFKYFTNTIVPSLMKFSKAAPPRGQGVLIFIPSYMDFVRVRNFMANSTETQHISFGSISEYTAVREVTRARSHFFSGRHAILLYTGRAHHFRRYHIRGVKRVIMYALPDNAMFYKEIVGGYLGNSISEGRLDSGDASVRSLFSKWDALKLERIVGTDRVISMLREKGGDTFEFL